MSGEGKIDAMMSKVRISGNFNTARRFFDKNYALEILKAIVFDRSMVIKKTP